ncbi:NAD(P)-binding protein [Daedalea quercina L-15889]|uniref:NAD(P)-binding protein n=1 Tax=Daedalea quercina L-15889 TaxID=1314783 RepID=A0A165N2D6_9APHY|nr:NAD(P)-binding protein [Daedalea quercina L-15889]
MASQNQLVWFITGTSSGLGECLVRSVLARGDCAIATVRQLSKFRLDIPDRSRLHVVELELTDSPENMAKIVAEAVSKWGRIDVLVNNAGIMPHSVTEEGGSQAAMTTFNTNFFGQINLVNAVLPYMRERKSGTIVNVGSRSAWIDLPPYGWYTASKAALHAYSVTLAREVASFNIRIVIAVPGGFQTSPNLLNGPNLSTRFLPDYDALREQSKQAIQNAWTNWKGAGDPAKAMEFLVDVVKGEGRAKGREAPLWLLLGQGTYDRARAYCKNLTDTMDVWEDLSKNLDFDTKL